ncbi:hypothetical protein PIB30_029961 [Stylosanthes scabra]|uniref:Uncharacterized protein n=1 Tax=Stylosanthes scabra TaxID=79078 RepID=A0ABU6XD38_9FABA|nr:hypothetical protein [Stylosanthes scabra]
MRDSNAWSFIPRGNDTHFTVVLLERFGALAEIITHHSPRLVALRSQEAAHLQPQAPVTPAISTPTSRLPLKKRPIQREAGEGTSKVVATSSRRRSQRLTTLSRTFHLAPKEQEVIAISSDSEPEPALKEASNGVAGKDETEDKPGEDPKEVPQNPKVENGEEQEEAAQGGAEGVPPEENDFADF